MKYVRGLLVVLLLGSMVWSSEGPFFESARLSGQYLQMLQGRQTVQSASGPGFGAAFTIPLGQRLGLELGLGYYTVGIWQDDALQQWGWSYYDSVYVKRVANDEEVYDVVQLSKQQMTIIPFSTRLNYWWYQKAPLRLGVEGGIGLHSYTRNFWLDETWGKEYNATTGEHYYEFSFNHYAPPKKGYVFLLSMGMDAELHLRGKLSMNIEARYSHLADIEGYFSEQLVNRLLGSDYPSYQHNYPFYGMFEISCGIIFGY